MRGLTLAILVLSASGAYAQDVPYPEGFRTWQHVSTMIIEPGHPLYQAFGGMHHLYANAQAIQGYLSGHFPDGAVIVFDLHEAAAGDHAVTAGARKVLGVMVRDHQRYAATGGWGFEGFKGDTRERVVGTTAGSACFACHQAQKDREYVFSTLPR